MTTFKSSPFHPDPGAPLYQALYAHMRTAILSGELKDGMKLPSTRALADELNISRNTVLNAYRQLLAEGYLESREGSGTFVAHVLPDLLLTAPHPDWRTPKTARSSRAAASGPFSPNAHMPRSPFRSLPPQANLRVPSCLSHRLWMSFRIHSGRGW